MIGPLDAYLPCRRKPPADGWAIDYPKHKRPQTKPHTQPGDLTAEQIANLRMLPAFRDMEARAIAAQHVVTKMTEGDL